jgi:predicted acetyltransferase
MVAVRWSNGQIDAARSWAELLHVVRKTQWAAMDEQEFRHLLAKRAWRWSLVPVDPTAPARRFFRELAEARLVEIVTTDKYDERKM